MIKKYLTIIFSLAMCSYGYAQSSKKLHDSIESDTTRFKNPYAGLPNHQTVEELPEVALYKNRNLNAVALGIIPHEVEKLTLNQKRLRTAGDFKFVHLLSILGGSLQVDPILNAISGRTKKLKKIVAVEQKLLDVQFFERNYAEYISKNLHVPEADFGRFLYFIADHPDCTSIIESKNENKTELFICSRWVEFGEAK